MVWYHIQHGTIWYLHTYLCTYKLGTKIVCTKNLYVQQKNIKVHNMTLYVLYLSIRECMVYGVCIVSRRWRRWPYPYPLSGLPSPAEGKLPHTQPSLLCRYHHHHHHRLLLFFFPAMAKVKRDHFIATTTISITTRTLHRPPPRYYHYGAIVIAIRWFLIRKITQFTIRMASAGIMKSDGSHPKGRERKNHHREQRLVINHQPLHQIMMMMIPQPQLQPVHPSITHGYNSNAPSPSQGLKQVKRHVNRRCRVKKVGVGKLIGNGKSVKRNWRCYWEEGVVMVVALR